ncbi:MAG: hypothetical protein IT548_19440 [Alphaproteobacteria bacterium]|nr:hypothetical protein [Alphaproteobacteria bacterium]
MACCAFAAFIISQIILGLDALRARLGLRVPEAGAPNPNAMWRLDGPPAAVVAPSPLWRMAVPVTIGSVLVGLVVGIVFGGADGSGHMFAFDFICTRDGLVRLAGIDR